VFFNLQDFLFASSRTSKKYYHFDGNSILETNSRFFYLIINQEFRIYLDRPSQIAKTNLLRINRIEAIASSLVGIEISARSESLFVSIKQIVEISKVIHSQRAVYSYF